VLYRNWPVKVSRRQGRAPGRPRPARWRRPGTASGLADDEQARVLSAAERAGKGAAIQVDSCQHFAALPHTGTVLVADVGVPDGALGIYADSVRVIAGVSAYTRRLPRPPSLPMS
jgi:hypothetical protein